MKKNLMLSGVFILIVSLQVTAQQILRGQVKNEKGQAIEAATIHVRGTKTTVAADAAGNFSLRLPEKLPAVLHITAAGYQTLNQRIESWADTVYAITLGLNDQLDEVVITSRRRSEVAQDVPIAISVVSGSQVDNAGAFNVNRLKEIVPSVQLYTSNPRNTGINIRGLGSPFGLTNDGLDPGVGFYVDGVYFARPAAATLDFIDIEQIEVLRGPQGTLFGKNTTSGSFNITTRKPTFKPGANFELSYGNYAFVQAKASVTGAISKKIAGRLSFSGTSRNGVIENVRTRQYTNELDNIGVRGQLLYKPFENTSITLAGDYNDQRPDGYAQVVGGVVQTKREGFRQFDSIAKDLNYKLPSTNPFDRKIDTDVPWNSGNGLGGVSLNIDQKIGRGKLTATTSWRYWDWDPSNDRDFTGLQALVRSANKSRHTNWSQEIRYAGELTDRLSGVVGLYYIDQEVKTDGLEQAGKDQWRFSQNATKSGGRNRLWETPGLVDGRGIRTNSSIKSQSAAAFANIDWEIVKGLHVLPGIRFNYDRKDVLFDRRAFGGLDTATYVNPAITADSLTKVRTNLQNLINSVYRNQFYVANAEENNFTYQLTLAYRPNQKINAFATYSTSFKPIGVNVAGLPTVTGSNDPDLSLAVIKPEYVTHYEFGIKSNPTDNLTVNIVYHNTDIKDYQTNVQSAQLNVNRGYIANAEAVNVKGVELDANYRFNNAFSFFGALTYTDGRYVKFTNAPLPLEETGLTENGQQKAFKDVSGGRLPGISEWAGSLGGEYTVPAQFLKQKGKFFIAAEAFYRSEFSSNPTPSAVLNIPAYTIVNARLGFRTTNGFSAFLWSRNLTNTNYFEQLLAAGGNAGHWGAVLGDPLTYGITLRYALQ
ncbi:MAG: TonB-dependent receptor [Bacteroidetes bacterium]|nr:TonB-dependent receptor [Bacteroidota bacterium]